MKELEFEHNGIEYLLFWQPSCKSISYSPKLGVFYITECDDYIVRKTMSSSGGLEKNLILIGWLDKLSDRWFRKAGFTKEEIFDVYDKVYEDTVYEDGKHYTRKMRNFSSKVLVMKRKLKTN
jgi:hypothetical protein